MALPKRILIINDGQDCGAPYGPLFKHLGEICSDPIAFKLNPADFKLLVFTGGADISPHLYGDTSPKSICCADLERDREEMDLYKLARANSNKMVGICRGMQFLNVMDGGKMVHDLSLHGSGEHEVMTRDRSEPFTTNSYHHQMCIPQKDAHILAWSNARLSKYYIGDNDELIDYKGPEVEAIYIPCKLSIGVQWHPEVSIGRDSRSKTWFKFLIKDFISKSPFDFKRLYFGVGYANIHVMGS